MSIRQYVFLFYKIGAKICKNKKSYPLLIYCKGHHNVYFIHYIVYCSCFNHQVGKLNLLTTKTIPHFLNCIKLFKVLFLKQIGERIFFKYSFKIYASFIKYVISRKSHMIASFTLDTPCLLYTSRCV